MFDIFNTLKYNEYTFYQGSQNYKILLVRFQNSSRYSKSYKNPQKVNDNTRSQESHLLVEKVRYMWKNP